MRKSLKAVLLSRNQQVKVMVSVYHIYRYYMMFSMQSIIRVGLNEPHTSEKDGKSIVLAKIIVEIWISAWYQCYAFTKVRLQIRFKTSGCVHHVNNYKNSLLMLHVRLIHEFITQRITRVVD